MDLDNPGYRDSFLNRLDSTHIDLEGKEKRHQEKGGRDNGKNANYESIKKDEKECCENSVDIGLDGKEEGKTEKGERDNDKNAKKEWWEEEIMTDSAAVVVVGFSGGLLGFMLFTR